MSVIFMDGFDHYAVGDVSKKWSYEVGGLTIVGGRVAGSAMKISSASYFLRKNLPSNYATLIVGFAAYIPSSIGSGGYLSATLRDNTASTRQCSLHINENTTISFHRNLSDATLGTSSSGAFALDEWFHVEFKVTLSNTVGAIEVKINGITVLTVTSVDTCVSANEYANSLQMEMSALSSGGTFDDLFILDTSGATNNDFIGDHRILTLLPDGAGDTTQFAPSAGSNYGCVDEASFDSDTTYVEADTTGEKDLYTFGALSYSPSSIAAVQVGAFAKKTDTPARSLSVVGKSGTTEDGSAGAALTTDYLFYGHVIEEDPDTLDPWDASGVNAMQAGVEVA